MVKMPDNLTRYRIMAVAVDTGGKQFGKGESSLTARLPIMVRPSAPRFANFGDMIELPIVVQNQTDEALSVDVAVDAINMQLLGDAGQRITVPANDRVEVRFPMTTQQAGTARFQVAVTAGEWADAAQFEFPVYTPATTEAFAVYGVDRRRGHRPAGDRPHGRLHPVRRAGDQHLVHGPAGPDRCRALSDQLSV